MIIIIIIIIIIIRHRTAYSIFLNHWPFASIQYPVHPAPKKPHHIREKNRNGATRLPAVHRHQRTGTHGLSEVLETQLLRSTQLVTSRGRPRRSKPSGRGGFTCRVVVPEENARPGPGGRDLLGLAVWPQPR